MKKLPTINELLAEFCVAKSATTPPKGYLNAIQFAERIGKGKTAAKTILYSMVKAGRLSKTKVGVAAYYGPFADA